MNSFSDRPDGTDENLYPKWNELLPSEWAWEFLRRNPEYRQDREDRKNYRIPDNLNPFINHPAFSEYLRAGGAKKLCEMNEKQRVIAAKWGFSYYLPSPDQPVYLITTENAQRKLIRRSSPLSENPRQNIYGGKRFGIFSSFFNSNPKLIHEHHLTTDDQTILVKFDLRKSLDTQWAIAEKHLKQTKSDLGIRLGKSKGKHSPNWERIPWFLRVLDAENSQKLDELFSYKDSESGKKSRDPDTANIFMREYYKNLPEYDGLKYFAHLPKTDIPIPYSP